MSFREVLGAVDPTNALRSAQQLSNLIGEPLRPLSLRRLIHRALAFRMQHQSLIKHVFVLMLENRSFDHIFGYSGIVGTDSRIDMITEVEDLRQHDGTNVNPRTGEIIRTSPTAPLSLEHVVSDVEHEFLDVLTQLCGPAAVPGSGVLPGGIYPQVDNSGFVANFVSRFPTAPPETPMQCFAPANLPVLNMLAKEFVICDHWFASHPGPTWPNRFFVHAASPSTDGQADSPPDIRIAEAVTGVGPGKFHFVNGTVYDRLAEKGRQHKIYCGNDCPQVRGIRANHIDDLNIVNLRVLQPDLQDPNYSVSYIFLEPDNGEPDHTILGIGVHCNSTKKNDMHPPSNVADGEALIKQVYETIRNSPAWNQCVFVVLFDEHGGFFDHVRPPATVPPGDGGVDNTHHFQFNQLGVRIPAIIVSPWVGRNVVDHTIYDHSSLLATVEKLFGLSSLTQRDAGANDFLEVFSQITPRTDTPQTLPPPATTFVTG